MLLVHSLGPDVCSLVLDVCSLGPADTIQDGTVVRIVLLGL